MLQQSRKFRWISLLIKVVIAAASLYYIYYKIFNRTSVTSTDLLAGFRDFSFFQFSLLFILMLGNWLIECVKWKLIVDHIQKISMVKSLKAILVGITVSVFTPNRAGEFGGRVFFLEPENRIRGIVLTFLGNFAQLLITVIAGVLGLLFYLQRFTPINSRENAYLFLLIVATVVIIISGLLLFYFNVSLVTRLLTGFKLNERIRNYFDQLEEYSFVQLTSVFVLSLFRYIIFTAQFYLLLHWFNVQVSFLQGIVMIALTFFAITAIPTITLTELGVRGSAALAFIGLLSDNNSGIIAASFALWLINIAIPAIAGSLFVFELKFFKTNQ